MDSAHIDTNPLVSPSAGGSSAYVRSKDQGPPIAGNSGIGQANQGRINKQYNIGGTGPVEIAELTTPRNAIGNFSGAIMPNTGQVSTTSQNN